MRIIETHIVRVIENRISYLAKVYVYVDEYYNRNYIMENPNGTMVKIDSHKFHYDLLDNEI